MKGFTQEQLAEKLGKSAGYIGAVEAINVERAISLDMLFYIIDLLGVRHINFFSLMTRRPQQFNICRRICLKILFPKNLFSFASIKIVRI